MIDYFCSKCGGAMSVPESLAGQQEKCPACGTMSIAPGTPAAAAPPTPLQAVAPQPQVAPAPAQPVIVVQQQQQQQQMATGRRISALGVVALVLGILAILGCWIPVVNFVSIFLAGLGILFAMIGFFVALTGRRTGLGMPIAGGFVCTVAIIIAIVVLGLVGGAMTETLTNAKVAVTQLDLEMIGVAVDTSHMNLGRYPTTDEGLEVLFTEPSDPELAEKWRGPYVPSRKKLTDAWGNRIRYEGPTRGDSAGPDYRLWSLGPDGQNDTADDIVHTPTP